MEFSRQEYWGGLPFPSPGDLPNPGIEPGSPELQQILYHVSHQASIDLVTDFISRLNFASFSLMGNSHRSGWSRCFYWVSPGLKLTYWRAECWTLQSSMGILGVLWTYSSTWCIVGDPDIVCLFLSFLPSSSSFFFFLTAVWHGKKKTRKMQFKLIEPSVLFGLVLRCEKYISAVIQET